MPKATVAAATVGLRVRPQKYSRASNAVFTSAVIQKTMNPDQWYVMGLPWKRNDGFTLGLLDYRVSFPSDVARPTIHDHGIGAITCSAATLDALARCESVSTGDAARVISQLLLELVGIEDQYRLAAVFRCNFPLAIQTQPLRKPRSKPQPAARDRLDVMAEEMGHLVAALNQCDSNVDPEILSDLVVRYGSLRDSMKEIRQTLIKVDGMFDLVQEKIVEVMQ